MRYQHTQRGTVILAVCVTLTALAAVTLSRSGLPPTILLLVILGAVAILFSSLTVEVGDNEVRWYFGPGLWTYRLPLDEIQSVAVVRNRWTNGFGIRMGPGFRLYNVSGLDAVEIRLTSGDVRRIGTDDSQGLAAALQARR